MKGTNLPQNRGISPKWVRISYTFGIIISVVSIFSSGFENNPRRTNPGIIFNSTSQIHEAKKQIEFVELRSTSTNNLEYFDQNLTGFAQTIKIPIEPRKTNGSGTAFLLGPGLWITARHVVNGCEKVVLGKEKAERIFFPSKSDLALFKLSETNFDYFGFSEVLKSKIGITSAKKVKIGDDAYSIGFPKGAPGQAHLRFAGNMRMIQHGAYYANEPVKVWIEESRQPKALDQMGGISGGPIFDSNGKILGVHVANSIRKGRAYSVHVTSLLSLLDTYDSNFIENSQSVETPISIKNWSSVADKWRSDGLIKKVFCYL